MSPRWNWDSPTPLAASECALPPGPKGGGAHSPAAKGVGESQFQRLEKRLALCLLCVPNCTPPSISRKCSTVPGKKLNYIMASVAVGIRCMGPLGGKQGFLPSQHSIAYSLGHLFNFSLVLLNFFAISCLPTCLF